MEQGTREAISSVTMRRFDVVIAGMGGIGGSAAFHLAARGAKVLALDPFPIAHAHGSSHGQTRLIRLAYFDTPTTCRCLCGHGSSGGISSVAPAGGC